MTSTRLRHDPRRGGVPAYGLAVATVVAVGAVQALVAGIAVAVFLTLRHLSRAGAAVVREPGRPRPRPRLWPIRRTRAARHPSDADGTARGDSPGRTADEPRSSHAHRPWTPWRGHHGARQGSDPAAGDGHLLSGIGAFQRDTAPLVREELARLAREGQSPSQLFLTCADSRLVTSMITSSGPGDLFTVRNVGNLMPPPGSEASCDSVAAAVQYAVEVLRVSSITVCGHSGCGAMQALLGSGNEPGAPTPLARWLRHGQPSLARMGRIGRLGRGEVALADRPVADNLERLALVNVLTQLDHLMAHPCVARRVAEDTLRLHGMYFHVAEAQAYMLDRSTSVFSAVRPEAAPTGHLRYDPGPGPGPDDDPWADPHGLTTKV
jgi:carbonic anhydrase